MHSHNQKMSESNGLKTKGVDVNEPQKPQPVSRQPSTEPTEAVSPQQDAEVVSPELKAERTVAPEERGRTVAVSSRFDPKRGWLAHLDGNTFLIEHSMHMMTHLITWGGNYRDMGPYPNEDAGYPVTPNCWWIIKKAPNTGPYTVYTISPLTTPYKRITLWADGYGGDKGCGLKDGPVDSNGLWYIVRSKNEGKYCIRNFAHPDRALAQWGDKGSDWGTYSGMAFDWILFPRFQVKLEWSLVWGIDNRDSTNPVTHVEDEEVGIKLTRSSTLSTHTELVSSMTLAVSAGVAVEGVGEFGESAQVESTITDSMDQSMTTQVEKNWLTKKKTTFVVPAGKDYRVKAIKTTFTSPCSDDDMTLYTAAKYFKVDESSSKLPGLNVNCPCRPMIEGVDFTSEDCS